MLFINSIKQIKIMAENIKYQINGQLADNTVTVDNKEDMILVPVSIGSANEARIIAEMKAEDSGLREETIKHVFELEKRVIKRLLMSGYNVNTGLYYASVSFRGVIENSQWNPAKNSIVVNFNVGADLRQAIKNTTVGIIGGTGSSKTTLIQLISRLYDVTEGSVRVGGVDVRNYGVEALRNQVAVVLQNNVLFSGTILDNLRWGDPEATEEECKHACELACADEFIQKMPKGYHTYIEQGGTNVSGGQKQRLCIARALLKKPKVLILDDSTSAVDTATDASIRRAFAEEIPGTTKLIIAQRISSIQNCDRIIVMEDGRVNDFGAHEELLARNQIYQEIYESQAAGNADFDEPGKE